MPSRLLLRNESGNEPGHVAGRRPARMTSNFGFVRCLSVRVFLTTFLFLFIALPTAHAIESLFGSGPSPLPVEEAFPVDVEQTDAGEIQVIFDVEDGYYLYKKRLGFTTNSNSVTLGAPTYPEPLIHEDEYFGKSEIFRDKTVITIPFKGSSNKPVDVQVSYQGCADIGLCYPPTEFSSTLASMTGSAIGADGADRQAGSALAKLLKTPQVGNNESNAASSPTLSDRTGAGKSSGIDLSALTNSSLGNNTADKPLLKPTDAFIPSISSANNNAIELRWFIEDGYYLYRDKLNFELRDAGGTVIGNANIDRGVMQEDPYFGEMEILRGDKGVQLALNNYNGAATGMLDLYYQGCADIGVCFPPEKLSIPVAFTPGNGTAAIASTGNGNASVDGNSSTSVIASTAVNATTVPNDLPVSEQDKLTNLLGTGNLGVIALAFYAAGLLLAFTACVYPMIPILSSLIVGQGSSISTAKAFGLSSVYVLSMASVFAVVGVLVGLSGFNIQPLFQNPWVLTAFALLFVVLALSMFGLFRLQMPSAIQARVTEMSNRQKGGSWTGVAVMGTLSALIVGPCVTPPLVAALAYIANTGNAAIGGIALFAIGLGMGTPLLLIGTSLGKFMPKAGGWMDATQRVFGIILLAVAIYLLSRFLPANVIMLMCAVLAIFTGVYFGATDKLDSDSRGSQRFGKSVGLVAVVYGVALMVGALSGNTSVLSPLKGFGSQQIAGVQSESAHAEFQIVKSTADLDRVLAEARNQQRPVMLDFYADWCVSCKEMEAFTFPDPRVQAQLKDAILLQADVTKNDDDDKAMLERFGLFGPPGIILYDRAGTELSAGRVVGYMPADKFSEHLKAFLNRDNTLAKGN